MTGIYKITCVPTGTSYIGQSVAIKRRWATHQRELASGKHYNQHLQRAYDKYGKENFTYEILEQCSKDKLNEREEFYIKMFDTYQNGFNQDLGGCNITGEANPMYGKSGKDSPRYVDQIYQLDKMGNIIGEFESCVIAAKAVNGQAAHILDCLKSWKRHSPSTAATAARERFTHKDSQWIYKQDYEIFKNNNYDFSQKRSKKSITLEDLINKGALDGDI